MAGSGNKQEKESDTWRKITGFRGIYREGKIVAPLPVSLSPRPWSSVLAAPTALVRGAGVRAQGSRVRSSKRSR